MSNRSALLPQVGLEPDLSRLTERLESEMGRFDPPARPAPRDDEVAIAAPAEAVVTIAIALCVAAVWLVKVLPY